MFQFIKRVDTPQQDPAQNKVTNDETQHVATGSDTPHNTPRPDVTSHVAGYIVTNDTLQQDMSSQELEPHNFHPRYTLSIDDAYLQFIESGVPRSRRTIVRYCENGELDCRKAKTALNTEKWVVNDASIHVRIEQLKQVQNMQHVMSRYDQPRPDVTSHVTNHDTTNDTLHKAGDRGEGEEINQLRKENQELKEKYAEATVQIKAHAIIEQGYAKQISRLQNKLMSAGRVIGEASRLLHLRAPKEEADQISMLVERIENAEY